MRTLDFAGRDAGCGISFDVNSLYPSRMRYELLPYGEPRYFKGEPKLGPMYELFIADILIDATVKPDHLPCMQFKDNFAKFAPTEYVTDTQGIVVRCVTSAELDLIREQYDIHHLEFVDGYMFKGSRNLFADFVDETMEGKSKATIEGNKGMRQLFKLRANSSYGKFGTGTRVCSMKPTLLEDGRIRYVRLAEEEREPVYVPVAAFITAYARSYTIRAAQANYPRFMYADTDSIYLQGYEPPVGIEVDDVKLGAWKQEHKFQRFKALRAKTYIFEEDGELVIHCAGLPDRCHDWNPEEGEELPSADGIYTEVTFDNFEIGAEYWGKLYNHHAAGGSYFTTGAFKIRS